MQENVVTYVYLPTEVRAKLEARAQQTGSSVSEAARRFILEGLERQEARNEIWIRTALTMLLRYHPKGDLEIAVNESVRTATRVTHG